MKFKKFTFPAAVMAIALALMVVFCVVTGIAMKPTIPQHDFPFSLTFEMDGETTTINGVYSVSYTGNDGYVQATNRIYEGVITSDYEGMGTSIILRESDDHAITLHTNFEPDYLIGDPAYEYYTNYDYAPILTATDWVTNDTAEGLDLSEKYGVKILSWDYPQPIENSLKFSHITHMSGIVVLPLVLMALAALIVILIFFRKDKTLPRKPLGVIGVVFNFLIAGTILPFATIYGMFSDIVGSSGAILHQLGYVIPAFIVLCLAASVSLRRRGYLKSSFAVQFIGPAAFGLLIMALYIVEGY